MHLTWIVVVIHLILTGCTAVPMIAARLDPGRLKAGAETKSRCEEDGGIRVYQKIEMQKGRFPTIIPDTTNSLARIKQGTIMEFTDMRNHIHIEIPLDTPAIDIVHL